MTLWEALTDALPFQADNQLALLAAIREQRTTPIPRERGVPTWLTRALLRGMRALPEERYPQIDDLLAELARDPARTRRRGLLALGLAAGVAAAAARPSRAPDEPDLCGGAERASAGVWDAEQRDATLAAFRATGESYAESAHRRAARRLDERLDAWRAMYTDACAATQIRGEQSAELMDRRMACLQERLEETRALVRAFAAADVQVVARAVQATEDLRGLDGCADLRGLTETRDEPADPERKREIAALRLRIAEANGAWAAGRYAQGLAKIESVLAAASTTGSCGLAADVSFMAGRLHCATGQAERGSAELAEAVWRATACRRDETAVEALLSNLYCSGVRLARYEEAAMWARHAEAAVERLGGAQESRRASLLGYRGLVAFDQGRYREALALHEEALALAERSTPDSERLSSFLGYLGITLERLGEFERSLELHRRALARTEQLLGADHPTAAVHLNNIGNLLSRLGRPAEALRYSDRDLELSRRAHGERHPDVALSYINHAAILSELGRHDEALPELARARTILEEIGRREHPDYIVALNNLGELSADLGDDEAGRAALHEALDLSARLQGEDHLDATYAELALAGIELRAGNIPAARAHVEHARGVRQTALGPGNEETAETEVMLGRIEAAEGRCEAALRHYAAAQQVYATALPTHHPERRTLGWREALCLGGAALDAAATDATLSPGSPELRASLLLRAADLRWAQGQHDLARATARTAALALAKTGPGLAALRARAEGWTGGTR